MTSVTIAMTTDEPAPASPVATAPPPQASTKPAPSKPKLDALPPFRVLLHNDDANDMVYVVETILELTPLNKERAVTAMLEAHTQGLSLLLVTHREKAELYLEQFQSKKLVVTIEPAT